MRDLSQIGRRVFGVLPVVWAAAILAGMAVPGSLPAASADPAAEPAASGPGASSAPARQERLEVRRLASFEDNEPGQDGLPVKEFLGKTDNAEAIYVMDNCITDGQWCARWRVPQGGKRGTLSLEGDYLKDWSGFDYFAFDLFSDDEKPFEITVELSDTSSKDDATRCTLKQPTHSGRQQMLFPIAHARLNGGSGEIDLKHLTSVKISMVSAKDRDAKLWIDYLRLVQEDAARPKMVAFLARCQTGDRFGGKAAGLQGPWVHVAASDHGKGTDSGFPSAVKLVEKSGLWPDLLSGSYVYAPNGEEMTFRTAGRAGSNWVWILGGRVTQADPAQPYYLAVNDQVLIDEKPGTPGIESDSPLYRFLWTEYSQRPGAAWLDYVDKMYPSFISEVKAEVKDHEDVPWITIKARNVFLCAVIVNGSREDAEKNDAIIRKARQEFFYKHCYPKELQVVAPQDSAGRGYYLSVPRTADIVLPDKGLSQTSQRTEIKTVGALGQNVFIRLAVKPDGDLGQCRLELADLKGPDGAVLPKSAILGHVKNYRATRRGITEMILLPTLSTHCEAELTREFWLWLTVPDDAKPGKYTGKFTFKPEKGQPTAVPVEIEVFPFRLAEPLPVAYGMYYHTRYAPAAPKDQYFDVMKAQFQWMRRLGMTSVQTPISVTLKDFDEAAGKVTLNFDAKAAQIAKDAGMARHPSQQLMVGQLGLSRAVARKLLPRDSTGESLVDSTPGSEMANPKMHALDVEALKQYKALLDGMGLPYACEITDEPREIPNAWNRNLKDTCAYGDWMNEAGFTSRFVTPLGDTQSGLDYTPLIDHTDIISIHAWRKSDNMLRTAKARGRAIWFYNSGMSRFVWGVYAWTQKAQGIWQWHWSYGGPGFETGYPGQEWYNPFGGPDGMACSAPLDKYPGGFLYKSDFLTAADGITDYAYLYTLEQALLQYHPAEAPLPPAKAKAFAEAKALLERIRAETPAFPHEKGEEQAVEALDGWRAQIGRLIIDLK